MRVIFLSKILELLFEELQTQYNESSVFKTCSMERRGVTFRLSNLIYGWVKNRTGLLGLMARMTLIVTQSHIGVSFGSPRSNNTLMLH